MGEVIEIKKYSNEFKTQWDEFIDKAKNGSFHLKRDFVEYHKDRFTDYSLLIFEKGVLIGVVPANKNHNNIYSHQGLTYGGIIVDEQIYLTSYINLVVSLLEFLKEHNFSKFIIKEIPWTYTSVFNDDFNYLMQLLNATTIKYDVLPHINLNTPLDFQTRRKRSVVKAQKLGYEISETDDFTEYWQMLSDMLSAYDAKPVHTLQEIQHLKNYFPQNIKLFEIKEDGACIAGVLIFETNQVARAQYIASSKRGKETGALDLLFSELITTVFKHKKYFDFGTTTLDGGNKLNFGLSDQKEGFGARTIVQHTFEIDIVNLDLTKITNLQL